MVKYVEYRLFNIGHKFQLQIKIIRTKKDNVTHNETIVTVY